MARTDAKNLQKYPCEHPGCQKRFTRKNDVKRHAKTHLTGEQLESEKHTCPVTEAGCTMASLQLGNVKIHIREKHSDVKHLVCFDCRPSFRLFDNTTTLAKHAQAQHLPTSRRQMNPPKPRRKVTKRLWDIVSPLPPSNTFTVPPPPTDRFPLPPTAPRRRKSPLPDVIIIAPLAFPKDDPEPPRDPSRPRPQWYRAPQPKPKISSLRRKARDISGIKKRARWPLSPTPSPSTAGGECSSSRFPLPPPPPYRLATSALSA
ncbi:uncharacterized protein EV420DRAFT_1022457 [Desarmillaria tabescens]|uniref:C2H2-type domain-containing protein n=1 Tax=Armillaria tabescens TaxID=1929756 RepID=A0AA39MRK9_ARMTA|nr:uncharacterized protein EV420DRAFT_1022457 [Desarmillaria tabescens]KAK0443673.1 hypothetical protein EV420DRAFT_1022457 [Desarmillaria tabescens]